LIEIKSEIERLQRHWPWHFEVMTALVRITAVKPLDCDKGLVMSNNGAYNAFNIKIFAAFHQ